MCETDHGPIGHTRFFKMLKAKVSCKKMRTAILHVHFFVCLISISLQCVFNAWYILNFKITVFQDKHAWHNHAHTYHIYTYVSYIYIFIHMYICTYNYVIYIYTYPHRCTYTHAHTHRYTYRYTH